MSAPAVLQVALPVPLRRLFDYLPPAAGGALPAPGSRVLVPFGRRRLVGLVVGVAPASEQPEAALRAVLEVLDRSPLLRADELSLLTWSAAYYHHPLGEVLAAALPAALRQGRPAVADLPERWCLTAAGREVAADALRRAPRQYALHARLLEAGSAGLDRAAVAALPGDGAGALRGLQRRGWA
ncbi:MAG TPA: primosomal protein N', partial [Gammaproteobacteria bacterium]